MRARNASIIAVLGLAAGCATIDVGANFDPRTAIAPTTTFDFEPRGETPTGDPRLDGNPFFESRLTAAVAFELAAKGLRRSAAAPTLLVHYHASVDRRLDVIQVDRAGGYVTDTTGYAEWEEGTIVVDIVDAATKRVIWRGWGRSDLAGVLSDPHTMDAYVQKLVHKMFERFTLVR
ncbi:MAG TPA: DUF4136 domain-containing protein [Gemmatimonadaceae bacterium]